jgi:hypothetical protein
MHFVKLFRDEFSIKSALLGLILGHLKIKGASFAQLAFQPHPPAMPLRDGFDNRQA